MSKQSTDQQNSESQQSPLSSPTMRIIIAVAAAIIVLIVGVLAASGGDKNDSKDEENSSTIGEDSSTIGEVEQFTGLSTTHIEDPAQGGTVEESNAFFDQEGLPPAGGQHFEVWLNCGVYDQPVPTGNALHSLEHGAVWIAYQPDLPSGDVEILRDIVGDSGRRILSPYPDLAAPIVLTAWGFRLRLDTVDDDLIQQFISAYEDSATSPEPGASCRQGTGEPVS